jgi:hypothetical protein
MMKITKIMNCGTVCPTQWIGATEDNRAVYIRYRWGRLTVHYGEREKLSEVAAVCGKLFYEKDLNRPAEGYLRYSELKSIVLPSISLPKKESREIKELQL